MNPLPLLKSRFVQLGLALACGLWLGYSLASRPPAVSFSVNPANPLVKETTVQAPILTPKEITRLISDPTQAALAAKLVKENNALKQEVQTLTSTTAENKVSGGTDITGHGSTRGVVVEENGGVRGEDAPRIFQFKDYQLAAIYDSSGTHFAYTLQEGLRIIQTNSKDKDGQTHVNLRLYRDTPTGPVEVPTTVEALLVPDLQGARWFASPRVQGGFGLQFPASSRGGVVALQWLKRGTSKAAEDTTYAILSPAYIFNEAGGTPALLPFSLNLGRIPHNPLVNLWLSPSIDRNYKLGIVFSATF